MYAHHTIRYLHVYTYRFFSVDSVTKGLTILKRATFYEYKTESCIYNVIVILAETVATYEVHFATVLAGIQITM